MNVKKLLVPTDVFTFTVLVQHPAGSVQMAWVCVKPLVIRGQGVFELMYTMPVVPNELPRTVNWIPPAVTMPVVGSTPVITGAEKLNSKPASR